MLPPLFSTLWLAWFHIMKLADNAVSVRYRIQISIMFRDSNKNVLHFAQGNCPSQYLISSSNKLGHILSWLFLEDLVVLYLKEAVSRSLSAHSGDGFEATGFQRLQVSRILCETHTFWGISIVSRRETLFLTHFGNFMKICPIAISQEPKGPQKSMTYQNACTKCKEFDLVISFDPIQMDFY